MNDNIYKRTFQILLMNKLEDTLMFCNEEFSKCPVNKILLTKKKISIAF